jgi:hypothetical protein
VRPLLPVQQPFAVPFLHVARCRAVHPRGPSLHRPLFVTHHRAPSARDLCVGLPHAGRGFLSCGIAGLHFFSRVGRGFLERNFTSSARRPPRVGSRGSWLPLARDFTSSVDSRGLPVRTTSRGRVCLPLLLLSILLCQETEDSSWCTSFSVLVVIVPFDISYVSVSVSD